MSNTRRTLQCCVRSVCFFPKMCIAIGTVLARPDKNSDQPSTLRRSRFNLSARSRPAPNPMAPLVTAISASSGTVTLFVSEIFTFVLLSSPNSNHSRMPADASGSAFPYICDSADPIELSRHRRSDHPSFPMGQFSYHHSSSEPPARFHHWRIANNYWFQGSRVGQLTSLSRCHSYAL
jgi:hypothetical protein